MRSARSIINVQLAHRLGALLRPRDDPRGVDDGVLLRRRAPSRALALVTGRRPRRGPRPSSTVVVVAAAEIDDTHAAVFARKTSTPKSTWSVSCKGLASLVAKMAFQRLQTKGKVCLIQVGPGGLAQ